jgi:hypothetical protein
MDIFSWPPVAIASSLASVGVGMVNAREFGKARVCFVLVAILLCLPLADWLWRSSMTWPVGVLASLLGGIADLALLRSLWQMVARHEMRATAVQHGIRHDG